MTRIGYTKQDAIDANNAIKEAQLSLVAVLKDAYPVGCKVKAKLGRSIVSIEVTGHAYAYWSEPGNITGLNIKTGNKRCFHFSDIQDE